MPVIQRTIEIRSTPREVWTRLTDFPSMPTWFYGVASVRVPAAELGVGVERILTTIIGHSYRETIAHWRPDRSLSYVVVGTPTFVKDMSAVISLNAGLESVVLSWEIHYTPRYGILGRMVARWLLAPVMDRLLVWSLRRFKAMTEATPAAKRLEGLENP